jgi:hypothetical protein
MVERVVVLLGTVQFRLKIKVNVPESATLADTEKAARSTLAGDAVKNWTLVDELDRASLFTLLQRLENT